jgi:hypothetical protein
MDVDLSWLIPVAVDGGGEVTAEAKVLGLELLQKLAIGATEVVDVCLITYYI